jgi:hypothetical protein
MLDQVEGLRDILAAQTVANAADAVSVELWSQVIDPTRDYFSEFMLPPHLPTNMSELGRVLINTLRATSPRKRTSGQTRCQL